MVYKSTYWLNEITELTFNYKKISFSVKTFALKQNIIAGFAITKLLSSLLVIKIVLFSINIGPQFKVHQT